MNIIFDLDGTLTDSGPGIMNCARATFEKYGIPIPDESALRTIVGPPLRQSFMRFGISPEQVEEATIYYRSLYNVTGKYENMPYPGIPELVQKLKADGHKLYVATSKPEHMAQDIMAHFGLAESFDLICGALTDGIRDKKELVIAYLLEQIGGAGNAIMVGDTVFDVIGAKEHQIPTIAVSWGYGNYDEMMAAGAVALAHNPQELYSLIQK